MSNFRAFGDFFEDASRLCEKFMTVQTQVWHGAGNTALQQGICFPPFLGRHTLPTFPSLFFSLQRTQGFVIRRALWTPSVCFALLRSHPKKASVNALGWRNEWNLGTFFFSLIHKEKVQTSYLNLVNPKERLLHLSSQLPNTQCVLHIIYITRRTSI